ncbi:MAG: hypothetical protein H6R20_1762, partial [Proteobacteria bacterium]|nr:hypothetical protein [Pseudomonadota bacterium]
ALNAARGYAERGLDRLPSSLGALTEASTPYPVEIAPALRALAAEVDRATC